MTTPENTQPEQQNNPERQKQLETIDETKWDDITSVVSVEAAAIKQQGGEVSWIIYDNADPQNRTFEYNADTQGFPASSGKLHVAEGMVTSLLDPEQRWEYPARMVDLTGGGILDKAGLIDRARNKEYTVKAGDAMHTMLEDSSNTPVRLVAEQFSDGGKILSGIYNDLGYEKTTLESHPNGRFNFQASTPRESLLSLERILEFPDTMKGDPREGDEDGVLGVDLAERTASALWNNTVTNHGIRQGIIPKGKTKVASKSGEYNGDPGDENSPSTPAVRNDVFTVKNEKHQISGAIFISGNAELMDAADDALKHIGSELARAFNDTDGNLGSTATSNVVRPPEA